MPDHPVMDSMSARWTLVVLAVLALILVPFGLVGGEVETWSLAVLSSSPAAPLAASFVITVLAADVFLPVPSSITSTFAGALLGFWGGLVASTIGMTAGCALGYATGRYAGQTAAQRLLGRAEIERLEEGARRYGDWVVVISRPVPVLAEASTLFAGMGRMDPTRFGALVLLANVGISSVYAAVGAWAATVSSFLLVFGAAVGLPGLALLVIRMPGRGGGLR